MQHTLLAVFDNRSDAQRALDELLICGFSREQVRLSEGEISGQSDTAASGEGTGFGASIRHFFSDIFGTDRSEHAQMFSEAVTSGRHVLTLEAGSQPEVERAADIVERFGPLDIDEHARQWVAQGSAAMGGAGMQKGMQMSQQSASGSQQSIGPDSIGRQGTSQGSAGRQPGLAQTGSQQRADSTAMAGTQRGAEVGLGMLSPADDASFRGHWASNYASEGGSYEDYAPAYGYGSTMARSDQYRGRDWHDVESSLRSDWESRYPQSGWEKFKAAVRNGWERITS
jgi:hypothetical protein